MNINEELVNFIASKNMWVLRRKSDKFALNVSYSPSGLIWTTNKLGRALMFDRAFVSKGKITSIHPDGRKPSDSVIVEKYIPMNHSNPKAQVAEYLWLNKALKMWY